MATAVYRMIRDLRYHLVRHILGLRARFHDKNLSGVLVTRATSDFDNLSESLNMGILTSVVDIAVLFGAVVGMIILDVKMAIFVTALLPIVAYLISFFSKALKRGTLASRKKLADLNGFTQEALYAQSDLQILGAGDYAVGKFTGLNIQYRDAQMKVVVTDAVMFSVIDGISSIAMGAFFWLLVSQAFGTQMASVGVIIAFVQYINKVFDPVKNLSQRMAVLQGAFTAIDRIFGLLEIQDRIKGSAPCPPLAGEIRFSDVRFSYDPGGECILDHLSFHISPGTKVAIVGRTGSGKSTIIKILTKLYDGYLGSIKIDGVELSEIESRGLRRQIAIVPQDVVLFEGSIRFNVSLGDESVTEEQVNSAVQTVGLGPLLKKMPEGIDTPIREQGSNLSAGERQLIIFARAIARNPAIIILDEATANIDPESERLIQQATDRAFVGRTAIVIAHRLRTIETCNQILVLQDGKLVESGSHNELLAMKAKYFEMQSQKRISVSDS
jgi:ATP-binding cassette subfamily B protein